MTYKTHGELEAEVKKLRKEVDRLQSEIVRQEIDHVNKIARMRRTYKNKYMRRSKSKKYLFGKGTLRQA